MSYICKKCGREYTNQQYIKNRFCESCNTFLVKKKTTTIAGKRRWIFQTNPKIFRIHDWWRDYPNLLEMTWAVRQYQKNIRKGQQGIIWVAGKDGGIFATVETLTNPSKSFGLDPGEQEYWIERNELLKAKEYPRIKLRYVDRLFSDPIIREYCINDPILKDMWIFKQSQGTNFPLSKKHMDRIQKIINAR